MDYTYRGQFFQNREYRNNIERSRKNMCEFDIAASQTAS